MRLTRRFALTLAAGAAIALAGCSGKSKTEASGEEMSLGPANAPVTVYEYASVTCVHCATWDREVWPEFKRKYVDTGQVRYVFREILTPPANVASAGFLLARCAGKERYFDVVHALFRSQEAMQQGQQPRDVLLGVARSAGMTEAQFNACVSDEEQLEALNARGERWATQEGVATTPTFVIGKEKIEGAVPIERLDAVLQPLLQKSGGAKAKGG
jgi:protein-disulfide isomerase